MQQHHNLNQDLNLKRNETMCFKNKKPGRAPNCRVKNEMWRGNWILKILRDVTDLGTTHKRPDLHCPPPDIFDDIATVFYFWLNPSMGQINGANAFQCFSKDGKFNSKTQEFRPYMFTVRSHVSKPSTSLPIFSIMSICESTRKCQFDCANAFQFDFSSKF